MSLLYRCVYHRVDIAVHACGRAADVHACGREAGIRNARVGTAKHVYVNKHMHERVDSSLATSNQMKNQTATRLKHPSANDDDDGRHDNDDDDNDDGDYTPRMPSAFDPAALAPEVQAHTLSSLAR
jgi:hypothetical protein